MSFLLTREIAPRRLADTPAAELSASVAASAARVDFVALEAARFVVGGSADGRED